MAEITCFVKSNHKKGNALLVEEQRYRPHAFVCFVLIARQEINATQEEQITAGEINSCKISLVTLELLVTTRAAGERPLAVTSHLIPQHKRATNNVLVFTKK